LIAFCRDRIAGYKCPRSVDVRSEPFPLSGAGKVLKRELRKPFWENAPAMQAKASKPRRPGARGRSPERPGTSKCSAKETPEFRVRARLAPPGAPE
jgi:hypothetical protein